MTHTYYEEDFDADNVQRLAYFDEWFKKLAGEMAQARGITLSQYLSQIRNLTTFKAVLSEVFNQDPSLGNYMEGMSQRSFRLFFERPVIQEIVNTNLEEEPERIEEEIIPKPRAVDIEQVKKETRVFFKGSFKDKKTGKVTKTVGYKDEITVKGKKQTRFRDSKGRFIKQVK